MLSSTLEVSGTGNRAFVLTNQMLYLRFRLAELRGNMSSVSSSLARRSFHKIYHWAEEQWLDEIVLYGRRGQTLGLLLREYYSDSHLERRIHAWRPGHEKPAVHGRLPW
jgi:hypothetical protein